MMCLQMGLYYLNPELTTAPAAAAAAPVPSSAGFLKKSGSRGWWFRIVRALGECPKETLTYNTVGGMPLSAGHIYKFILRPPKPKVPFVQIIDTFDSSLLYLLSPNSVRDLYLVEPKTNN